MWVPFVTFAKTTARLRLGTDGYQRGVTAQYASWLAALAASVTMLSLGVRLRMFERPELRTRCAACRKYYWRGRTCPCARDD